MADINDLIKQFYSVNDLREMAQPIDTSKFRADLLSEKLIQLRESLQTADKDNVPTLWRQLTESIDDWVFMWNYDEGLVTKELFLLRSIRGLARNADKLLAEIKGLALEKEQEEFLGADVGPNETVMDQLRRKPIKESGVIIGYAEPLDLALNARIIFEHDPRWRKRIEYNEFAGVTTIDREFLLDHVCYNAKLWLEEHYQNLNLPKKEVGAVVDNIGRKNPFHPVKDKLNSLPAWDGVARLDKMLTKYFGANNTKLHDAYSSKIMIAAVARVFDPGCQVDTMLGLIGRQGAKKGQSIKALAYGDEWFSNTPIDIRNKDGAISIQGKWLVEIPECHGVFGGNYDLSKSWLTIHVDRYRAPFATYAEDHKRGCVFWATTNSMDLEFLADATGSRRFWFLSVKDIDLDGLIEVRDQLWAEALYRYHSGEPWWLSPALERDRGEQNKRFALNDSWEDLISYFLDTLKLENGVAYFKLEEVYDYLSIDIKLRDRKSAKRIAEILRSYNAQKKQVRKGHIRTKLWTWSPEEES
tara:strand:+ start:4682 stop:6265 length:1584 start_codon:yes stop_codon:yes gene_type:complete